jgi:hypothetical protein
VGWMTWHRGSCQHGWHILRAARIARLDCERAPEGRRLASWWELGGESAGKSNQCAYSDAGSAGNHVAIRLSIEERRPGNVEMCPRRSIGYELPKERGRDQSTSPAISSGRAQVSNL